VVSTGPGPAGSSGSELRPGLCRVDRDLFTAAAPLRVGGLALGTRMTVVRLSEGRLVLVSPIEPTPRMREAVEQQGTVAFLVCPSRWHHLYAGAWKRAYPRALLLAVPRMRASVADLPVDEELGSDSPAEWKTELQIQPLRGAPLFDERLLFHPASRTLIATDALVNFREASGITRLYLRLCGALGRPAHTLMHRVGFRDRAALRRSVELVLEWEFERMIVAHGEILESGGRDAFRAAFAWV